MDVERLRKPMQQITDYLLRCMGVKQAAKVIVFQQHNEVMAEGQVG